MSLLHHLDPQISSVLQSSARYHLHLGVGLQGSQQASHYQPKITQKLVL